MARFIEINFKIPTRWDTVILKSINGLRKMPDLHEKDKEWIEKVSKLSSEVTQHLDKYQFNYAAEKLYEFVWHQFADTYIEEVKDRVDRDFDSVKNPNAMIVIESLYLILLKLLHPFMPFVTEEIHQRLWGEGESLIVSDWPEYEK